MFVLSNNSAEGNKEIEIDKYDALQYFSQLNRTNDYQGQYIVKTIQLKDLHSKDATDFKVKAASIEILLNPEVFNPNSKVALPEISAELFDAL